jgi:hypothetical protein
MALTVMAAETSTHLTLIVLITAAFIAFLFRVLVPRQHAPTPVNDEDWGLCELVTPDNPAIE